MSPQTMQVMQEEEELVFLYQLIDGYADSSFACHIASLAGVPSELIKRAHQVRRLQRSLNRDLKIYDAVVNENARKQQYHWLKEEK